MEQPNSEQLKLWRVQAGLEMNQVDSLLQLPRGTVEFYEGIGLMKVPCCDLVKMAKFYEITEPSFFSTIIKELAWYRDLMR